MLGDMVGDGVKLGEGDKEGLQGWQAWAEAFAQVPAGHTGVQEAAPCVLSEPAGQEETLPPGTLRPAAGEAHR